MVDPRTAFATNDHHYERECTGCGQAWKIERKLLRINKRDTTIGDYEITWTKVEV